MDDDADRIPLVLLLTEFPLRMISGLYTVQEGAMRRAHSRQIAHQQAESIAEGEAFWMPPSIGYPQLSNAARMDFGSVLG